MKQPNIHRLLELQKLLETFNRIERVTHRQHTQGFVPENDTEHSYNLAITAWFLAQHFPELDSNLLIRLALVHDLVEVHAGDTYVYADAATIASKHQREAAALKQLQADWSDFPELLVAIVFYEERSSNEAKFVYALDKIMPIMQIYNSEGYTWKKEGITPEQLDAIKREKVALSPQIKPYYDQLYELLISNPQLFN